MSSASSSVSSVADNEFNWEVSEIIAERTSVTGENEVLVIWKSSWIPVSQLHEAGPVVRRWAQVPKWRSTVPHGMELQLPAESGSHLGKDMAFMAAAKAREKAQHQAVTSLIQKFTHKKSRPSIRDSISSHGHQSATTSNLAAPAP